MPSTTTHVTSVPLCQICFVHPAYADARIPGSSWAYVCGICFLDLGCSLGLGRGQELILASATALDERAYSTWYREVCRSMSHFCGMTPDDIDDYNYSDDFAAGLTPVASMRAAAEAAGFVL